MNFFNSENWFWKGFGRLADYFILSFCWLLCSIPVVTIGTATIALYDAVAHCVRGREPDLAKRFFTTFKKELLRGILLTGDDTEETDRAQHLRSTFSALLEMGVIPVVNENDSVSSAEIETGRHKVLGDNDTLSAIVAKLCSADLLVLLSDIDGLYDADPKANPDAKLLHQVTELTPEILDMAGGAGTWRGTGGMATKLTAARISMEGGCDMVITNGSKLDLLYGIVNGEDIGTRFIAPKKEAHA